MGGLLEGLAGEVVVLDVARDPGAEGHADEVDQGGSGGAVGDGAAGRVRAEPVAEQGRRRVVELVVLGLVVVLVLELVGLIEALVGELHGAGCAALGGGAHRSPPSPARGPDLGLPGPGNRVAGPPAARRRPDRAGRGQGQQAPRVDHSGQRPTGRLTGLGGAERSEPSRV